MAVKLNELAERILKAGRWFYFHLYGVLFKPPSPLVFLLSGSLTVVFSFYTSALHIIVIIFIPMQARSLNGVVRPFFFPSPKVSVEIMTLMACSWGEPWMTLWLWCNYQEHKSALSFTVITAASNNKSIITTIRIIPMALTRKIVKLGIPCRNQRRQSILASQDLETGLHSPEKIQ